MKKILSVLALTFCLSITSYAQVAIGTNTPSPSAQFEVFSTERGFLPPRMTSAQRDSIATPATGLLIFQTNNTAGYYYYNGTAWVNLGAMGAAGTNGTNGLNALIKTTTEVAGANCANGGTKIETGLDVNGNGVLEVTEVNASQTKYVCNGSSNSNNIGATGFNHFFPDGFVNTVKVNHTLIATCSNSTSSNIGNPNFERLSDNVSLLSRIAVIVANCSFSIVSLSTRKNNGLTKVNAKLFAINSA
jgi:hypothetical protein